MSSARRAPSAPATSTRIRPGRRSRRGHRRGTRRRVGPKSGAGVGLAGRAGRALGWSLANNAAAKLGTMAIGVMLARLLGPHAFGTYAVAYVALVALLNLNDLGVSLAIVRWPGEPAGIAPTVASISLGSSLIVYGVCFVAAPWYAAAMNSPAASGVIRVLAAVVVVDGAAAVPAGLLQRSFRQDLKLIADQVNVWLGLAVTVVFAWLGFGAMSLALGRLAGCAAALAVFAVVCPGSMRLGFDRAQARALIRFGAPLAGSGIAVWAVSSVDQLVVGRVLGVTALGYYVLAGNVSAWPLTVFAQPVRSVAPAAFARLRHDPPAMRAGFLSVAGLLVAVTLPVCLTMSGAAAPLIGLVYGPRWLPAAAALMWLAALAALQIFIQLVYDYFVVLAMPRVVFTLQVVWLVVLVPALVVGASAGGISGAGLAGVLVASCVILPWYLAELRKTGVRLGELTARLRLPVAAGIVAALTGAVAARAAPDPLLALAISAAAGGAVIGLLLYRLRGGLDLLRRNWARPGAAPVADRSVQEVSAAQGAYGRVVKPAGPGGLAGRLGPHAQPARPAGEQAAHVRGRHRGKDGQPCGDPLPGTGLPRGSGDSHEGYGDPGAARRLGEGLPARKGLPQESGDDHERAAGRHRG